VPYSSVSEALINDREKSSAFISLNGPWKFYYSDTPEATPAGFYAVDFNDRKWTAITVPSNWEMQGFGDPLFRNINTPFPPDPPDVPREYNPAGLYRKTFTVPSSWKNKEIFLRMEKTASASFVWINGRETGYNEGDFFSYGIGGRTYGTIWPDRRSQHEMWQIKKSAQPVTDEPVSLEEKVFRITNRFLFTDLNELQCVWMLQADAEIVETGEMTTNLPSLESGIFVIPFSKPDNINGREYRLLLSFRLKNKTLWADPGHEIAWEQIDLPWSGYSGNEENIPEGSL